MKKSVDIIVPCYNTKNHIFTEFEQHIFALIEDKIIENFRVILVNDGSSKKNYTPHIQHFKSIFKHHFVFIELAENKGKGGAIKEGIKHSYADIVIFYDIDFPFGRQALYEFYHQLYSEKNPIIIAKRDNSYNKKLPLKRLVISTIVKKIIYLLSLGKIKDSQAGLKGMHKNIVPILLETSCNSFLMDFEFLLKCLRKNITIKEIIVKPNNHIEFTNFAQKTLLKEIKNLFIILFFNKKL